MRKEVLLLFLVLFATNIYAACDVTDTIYEGSTGNYAAAGKDYTIKFSSLQNESGTISIKFEVNGVSTDYLEQGLKYTFTDLSEITAQSISPSANSSAQICFTAGLSGKKGTCSTNTDCEDNNPCTINECDGDPLRCHRTLILWCKDDDGCCPESRCTYEKDNDCLDPGAPINDTEDINSTNTTVNIECTTGDDFCPENCTFQEDTDCDECSNDEDCKDDNACTIDACSGTPKKCSNEATEGCNLNEECISIGTITENKFCNTDGTIQRLRLKGEYCYSDYECLTNQCIENKCKGNNFFKGIINWFKELFSK